MELMTLLIVENIETYYGKIRAIDGVSLNVESGEIVCLIGANGAGKTTTLKSICGLQKPAAGKILFSGEDLTKVPPHEIVTRGIALVPEGRHVFSRLSVKENLAMGAFSRGDQKSIREDFEKMFTLFPRLRERSRQLAGTLSGGEQQMLAIARALMAHPRLLLLDEPSMGLSPILLESIFGIIREINKNGTSILLVEQNALMALSIANRGYVLDTGKVVLSGAASELVHNPMVINAYLGGEAVV
jgi:branched-chain amino acid transport system ATP-binding protein